MLYAAKCYWPGVTECVLRRVAKRAIDAGRADYVGSLLFPADELVLCLFQGRSPVAVQRASEQAGIPCERVMETVWFVRQPEERSAPCTSSDSP